VLPAEGAEVDVAAIVAIAAIVAWSREALATYKYPRRIEFVVEFPPGPSGRILDRELMARYRY
jgi:acyl-CoA synthetase (AMP-forming)/AMP-acid ligase II